MSHPTDEEIKAALAALRQDELKQALTATLQRWLDDQLAKFGWWTAKGLTSLGLAALVALILWSMGPNK